MNVGILKVDPRSLAAALHMPEGTTIDNAQWDIHHGVLHLRVHHPDIPASPEGFPPYPANLVITQHVRDVSRDLLDLKGAIDMLPDSDGKKLVDAAWSMVGAKYEVSKTYTGEWK